MTQTVGHLARQQSATLAVGSKAESAHFVISRVDQLPRLHDGLQATWSLRPPTRPQGQRKKKHPLAAYRSAVRMSRQEFDVVDHVVYFEHFGNEQRAADHDSDGHVGRAVHDASMRSSSGVQP